MKFKPFIKKITALIVVLAYGLTQFHAQPAMAQSAAEPVSPQAFKIPKAMGTVEEVLSGNRKTIIYIQDAHDSLEAQENIARMVRYAVEHYGVKTVYEEGYEGTVPTDEYFGFIKNPARRQKVSHFLLDKLRIGGAEYAHINRKKDFRLLGADSIPLHLSNIRAYRDSARFQEGVEEDLDAIARAFENLSARYLPAEVRGWLKLRRRFDRGELDFLDYLNRLAASAKKAPGFKAAAYPHIQKVLALAAARNQAALEEVKNINPKTLFEEVDAFENGFAEQFLKDTRARGIYARQKEFLLLKRVNEFSVNSAEYEAALKILASIRTEDLARFIVENSGQSLVLSREWEERIANALEFYKIAFQRDAGIARALEDFAAHPSERTAVLVYGGFHKRAVKDMLAERGLSGIVVMPGITGFDARHQGYYRQLMSVGYLPYEKPLLHTASRSETLFTLPYGKAELSGIERKIDVLDASSDSFLLEPAGKRSEIRNLLQEETVPGAGDAGADPQLKLALDGFKDPEEAWEKWIKPNVSAMIYKPSPGADLEASGRRLHAYWTARGWDKKLDLNSLIFLMEGPLLRAEFLQAERRRVRVAEGSLAQNLVRDWMTGVAFAMHLRWYGPHLERGAEIEKNGFPYDNELVRESVRRLIAEILAARASGQNIQLLANPSYKEKKSGVKWDDLMLWGLAVMMDPVIHDFENGYFEDSAERARDLWPEGSRQGISEYFAAVLSDIPAVDFAGRPNGEKVTRDEITSLLAEFLALDRKAWENKGLVPPQDVVVTKAAYYGKKILEGQNPRPYLNPLLNLPLPWFGEQGFFNKSSAEIHRRFFEVRDRQLKAVEKKYISRELFQLEVLAAWSELGQVLDQKTLAAKLGAARIQALQAYLSAQGLSGRAAYFQELVREKRSEMRMTDVATGEPGPETRLARFLRYDDDGIEDFPEKFPEGFIEQFTDNRFLTREDLRKPYVELTTGKRIESMREYRRWQYQRILADENSEESVRARAARKLEWVKNSNAIARAAGITSSNYVNIKGMTDAIPTAKTLWALGKALSMDPIIILFGEPMTADYFDGIVSSTVIAFLRMRLGWTQDELADKLEEEGNRREPKVVMFTGTDKRGAIQQWELEEAATRPVLPEEPKRPVIEAVLGYQGIFKTVPNRPSRANSARGSRAKPQKKEKKPAAEPVKKTPASPEPAVSAVPVDPVRVRKEAEFSMWMRLREEMEAKASDGNEDFLDAFQRLINHMNAIHTSGSWTGQRRHFNVFEALIRNAMEAFRNQAGHYPDGGEATVSSLLEAVRPAFSGENHSVIEHPLGRWHQDRYEEVYQRVREAKRLRQQADNQAERGTEYTRLLDRAEETLLPAMELIREDVFVLHGLAEIALRRRERSAYEAAERYLRRILDQQPMHAAALNTLGRLAFFQGDLLGAIARYQRAAEAEPGNSVAANSLGQISLWLDKPWEDRIREARYYYDEVLSREPGNPYALVGRARTYYLEDLEVLIDSGTYLADPGDLEKSQWRNFKLALEDLQAAIRGGREVDRTYVSLGLFYMAIGNYAQARISFETAYAMNPENLRAERFATMEIRQYDAFRSRMISVYHHPAGAMREDSLAADLHQEEAPRNIVRGEVVYQSGTSSGDITGQTVFLRPGVMAEVKHQSVSPGILIVDYPAYREGLKGRGAQYWDRYVQTFLQKREVKTLIFQNAPANFRPPRGAHFDGRAILAVSNSLDEIPADIFEMGFHVRGTRFELEFHPLERRSEVREAGAGNTGKNLSISGRTSQRPAVETLRAWVLKAFEDHWALVDAETLRVEDIHSRISISFDGIGQWSEEIFSILRGVGERVAREYPGFTYYTGNPALHQQGILDEARSKAGYSIFRMDVFPARRSEVREENNADESRAEEKEEKVSTGFRLVQAAGWGGTVLSILASLIFLPEVVQGYVWPLLKGWLLTASVIFSSRFEGRFKTLKQLAVIAVPLTWIAAAGFSALRVEDMAMVGIGTLIVFTGIFLSETVFHRTKETSVKKSFFSALRWAFTAGVISRVYIYTVFMPYILGSDIPNAVLKSAFDLGVASPLVHVPLVVSLGIVMGEKVNLWKDLSAGNFKALLKSKTFRVLAVIYPANFLFWFFALLPAYFSGGQNRVLFYLLHSAAVLVWTSILERTIKNYFAADKIVQDQELAGKRSEMRSPATQYSEISHENNNMGLIPIAVHYMDFFGQLLAEDVRQDDQTGPNPPMIAAEGHTLLHVTGEGVESKNALILIYDSLMNQMQISESESRPVITPVPADKLHFYEGREDFVAEGYQSDHPVILQTRLTPDGRKVQFTAIYIGGFRPGKFLKYEVLHRPQGSDQFIPYPVFEIDNRMASGLILPHTPGRLIIPGKEDMNVTIHKSDLDRMLARGSWVEDPRPRRSEMRVGKNAQVILSIVDQLELAIAKKQNGRVAQLLDQLGKNLPAVKDWPKWNDPNWEGLGNLRYIYVIQEIYARLKDERRNSLIQVMQMVHDHYTLHRTRGELSTRTREDRLSGFYGLIQARVRPIADALKSMAGEEKPRPLVIRYPAAGDGSTLIGLVKNLAETFPKVPFKIEASDRYLNYAMVEQGIDFAIYDSHGEFVEAGVNGQIFYEEDMIPGHYAETYGAMKRRFAAGTGIRHFSRLNPRLTQTGSDLAKKKIDISFEERDIEHDPYKARSADLAILSNVHYYVQAPESVIDSRVDTDAARGLWSVLSTAHNDGIRSLFRLMGRTLNPPDWQTGYPGGVMLVLQNSLDAWTLGQDVYFRETAELVLNPRFSLSIGGGEDSGHATPKLIASYEEDGYPYLTRIPVESATHPLDEHEVEALARLSHPVPVKWNDLKIIFADHSHTLFTPGRKPDRELVGYLEELFEQGAVLIIETGDASNTIVERGIIKAIKAKYRRQIILNSATGAVAYGFDNAGRLDRKKPLFNLAANILSEAELKLWKEIMQRAFYEYQLGSQEFVFGYGDYNRSFLMNKDDAQMSASLDIKLVMMNEREGLEKNRWLVGRGLPPMTPAGRNFDLRTSLEVYLKSELAKAGLEEKIEVHTVSTRTIDTTLKGVTKRRAIHELISRGVIRKLLAENLKRLLRKTPSGKRAALQASFPKDYDARAAEAYGDSFSTQGKRNNDLEMGLALPDVYKLSVDGGMVPRDFLQPGVVPYPGVGGPADLREYLARKKELSVPGVAELRGSVRQSELRFITTQQFEGTLDIFPNEDLFSRRARRTALLSNLPLEWSGEADESIVSDRIRGLIDSTVRKRLRWWEEFKEPATPMPTAEHIRRTTLNPTLNFVLSEIMTNASDAVVRSGEKRRVKLRAERKDDLVHIYISDNGIGIKQVWKDEETQMISLTGNTPPVGAPLDNVEGGNGYGFFWGQILLRLHGGMLEVLPEKFEDFQTTIHITLPVSSVTWPGARSEMRAGLFGVTDDSPGGRFLAWFSDVRRNIAELHIPSLTHVYEVRDIFSGRPRYRSNFSGDILDTLLYNLVPNAFDAVALRAQMQGEEDYKGRLRVKAKVRYDRNYFMLRGYEISGAWNLAALNRTRNFVNYFLQGLHNITGWDGFDRLTRLWPQIHAGRGTFSLVIEDNGTGMPEEAIRNIFERGFTTKDTEDLAVKFKEPRVSVGMARPPMSWMRKKFGIAGGEGMGASYLAMPALRGTKHYVMTIVSKDKSGRAFRKTMESGKKAETVEIPGQDIPQGTRIQIDIEMPVSLFDRHEKDFESSWEAGVWPRSEMRAGQPSAAPVIRKDPEGAWERYLLVHEFNRELAQDLRRATVSKLDHYILLTTLTHLYASGRVTLRDIQEGIVRMEDQLILTSTGDEDTEQEVMEYLRVLYHLFLSPEKFNGLTRSGHDKRFFHFDLINLYGNVDTHAQPLSPEQRDAVLRQLLMSRDPENGTLMTSLRDVTGRPELSLKDLKRPVRGVRIQYGNTQDVYLIMATLKDGTLVYFTELVSRDFTQAPMVREEYNSFALYRGDERASHVIMLADYEGYAGYSSRFSDSEEFVYVYANEELEEGEHPGAFTKNSDLLLRGGEITGQGVQKVIAAYSAAATYFYDPEKERRVQFFTSQAGDLNFFDREFQRVPGERRVFEVRPGIEKLTTRLIAMRGFQDRVSPERFMDYLFGFEYLAPDRDLVVDTPPHNNWLVNGVLDGVLHGLEDRLKDPVLAKKTALDWFRRYLSALEDYDSGIMEVRLNIRPELRMRIVRLERELGVSRRSEMREENPADYIKRLAAAAEAGNVPDFESENEQIFNKLSRGARSLLGESAEALAVSRAEGASPRQSFSTGIALLLMQAAAAEQVDPEVLEAGRSLIRRYSEKPGLSPDSYLFYVLSPFFVDFAAQDAFIVLSRGVHNIPGPAGYRLAILSLFLAAIHFNFGVDASSDSIDFAAVSRDLSTVAEILKNGHRGLERDFPDRRERRKVLQSARLALGLYLLTTTSHLPEKESDDPRIYRMIHRSLDAVRRAGIKSNPLKKMFPAVYTEEDFQKLAASDPPAARLVLLADMVYAHFHILADAYEKWPDREPGVPVENFLFFGSLDKIAAFKRYNPPAKEIAVPLYANMRIDALNWIDSRRSEMRAPADASGSSFPDPSGRQMTPDSAAKSLGKFLRQLETARDRKNFTADDRIYTISVERNWPGVIERLARQPRPAGIRMHIGVSGLINEGVMAARESDLALLIGINEKEIRLHQAMGESIQSLPEGIEETESADSVLRRIVEGMKVRGFAIDEAGVEWLRAAAGLNTREKLRHVIKMFREGRVLMLQLDLFDEAFLTGIGRWMGQNGVVLDTFYISNIFDVYWGRGREFDVPMAENREKFERALTAMLPEGKTSDPFVIDANWEWFGEPVYNALAANFRPASRWMSRSEMRGKKDEKFDLSSYEWTRGIPEAYQAEFAEMLGSIMPMDYTGRWASLEKKYRILDKYAYWLESVRQRGGWGTLTPQQFAVTVSAEYMKHFSDMAVFMEFAQTFGIDTEKTEKVLDLASGYWSYSHLLPYVFPGLKEAVGIDYDARKTEVFYNTVAPVLGLNAAGTPLFTHKTVNLLDLPGNEDLKSSAPFDVAVLQNPQPRYSGDNPFRVFHYEWVLAGLSAFMKPEGQLWLTIDDHRIMTDGNPALFELMAKYGIEQRFFESYRISDDPGTFMFGMMPSPLTLKGVYISAQDLKRIRAPKREDVLAVRSEMRSKALDELERFMMPPFSEQFGLEIYSRQVRLLKDLGILNPKSSVFSFLTGADFLPGMFSGGFYTTERRFDKDQMAGIWKQLYAKDAVRLGLQTGNEDFESMLARAVHDQADVLDTSFLEKWTAKMKAGDVVYLRFVAEYLSGPATRPNVFRIKAWLDELVDLAPEGVHFVVFDKENLDFPKGTADYLKTAHKGLLVDEIQARLTPEDYQRWQRVNEWSVLRNLLKSVSFFRGDKMMDMVMGGRLTVLTKTSPALQEKRSEMREPAAVKPVKETSGAELSGYQVRGMFRDGKIPVMAYVSYDDLVSGFSKAQREELFSMAWLHPEKVRLVVYGVKDPMHPLLKPFRELRQKKRNVRLTSRGAEEAYESTQRDFVKGLKKHVNIHLSRRNTEARKTLASGKVRFFRYQSQDEEGGLLGAALLWLQYEEAGKALDSFEKDAEGYLTFSEGYLRNLAQAYDARMVIMIAA